MKYGKIRPVSHITGEIGVEILKRKIPQEWVVREYHPDYGIDLSIEIFTAYMDDYITSGEHLLFQVKSTKNLTKKIIEIPPRVNVEKGNHTIDGELISMEVVTFPIDTGLLSVVEKMGSAVPVILAVVDITTEAIYFVCLNDYIEKIVVPDDPDYTHYQTKTVCLPTKNCINGEAGIRMLEWYAKRPKLYALFNKINYQKSELNYYYGQQLIDIAQHFLKILLRYDAWDAGYYFPIMTDMREEIEFYLSHGFTKDAERRNEQLIAKGIDIDNEMCEATWCADLVPIRYANIIQGIHQLWEKLDTIDGIFEESCKEAFLPTYMGAKISNT